MLTALLVVLPLYSVPQTFIRVVPLTPSPPTHL